MQWPSSKAGGLYRLCYFAKGFMAGDTASGLGGSCRIGKTHWYRANAKGLGGTGGNNAYRAANEGHGIDNVVGVLAVQYRGGPANATVSPTALAGTVLNATTVRLQIEGFSAATVAVAVWIWGATSLNY